MKVLIIYIENRDPIKMEETLDQIDKEIPKTLIGAQDQDVIGKARSLLEKLKQKGGMIQALYKDNQ